ncbi:DUF6942 family protein [Psychromonas arctica]|uniref:DUF6942 family protein n=1 Tax=Psychromonas arctica TaxID=168275 RepID=UPI00040EAB43
MIDKIMTDTVITNKGIPSKRDTKVVALGDAQFTFAVYIANQPKMPEYESLSCIQPLQVEQIGLIGKACGNGWRKVFNVYAKLLYALDATHFNFSTLVPTWQQYRDQFLLQAHSGTALIFSPPHLAFTSISSQSAFSELHHKASNSTDTKTHTNTDNNTHNNIHSNIHNKTLHIICGRTYAKKLINDGLLTVDLSWLNEEFAINFEHAVIVCPYFDYRQLSNQKIQRLSFLLSALVTGSDEGVIDTTEFE